LRGPIPPGVPDPPGKDVEPLSLPVDAGDPRTVIELVLTNGNILHHAGRDGLRW